MSHEIKERETIIKLLNVLFPNVKVYLFGSRARGDHTERSDVDLALDAGRKLTRDEVATARSVIEGLPMLQTVDVVDLNSVSSPFREEILKEVIRWEI